METKEEVLSSDGIIADLHIHSRFARATSKNINIENLEKYARIKGINLLGTGDFQHPEWFKELSTLKEREGILYTPTGFPFLWQTEISLMYTQDGKGRRIHHVILAPDKEVVGQIIKFFKSKGRIDYDGRPIFGFSSIELVDAMHSISSDIEIIPAHCMTPWFGVFGSKSGFNSLQECFHERVDKIHAVESGLSADPEMLWRFSWLNDKAILSSSDSHSFWPWRLGRESTIFTGNLTYKNILTQIRKNSFEATVETDPAYGKYHWDGHRDCNFSCSPERTRELKGRCPVCHNPLTIGVDYRVEELGDNTKGYKPKNAKPFYKLLPLHELISTVRASTLNSQKVWQEYNRLLSEFSSEFDVLLKAPREKLAKITNDKLVEIIMLNRQGKLKVKPGYDSEYGELVLQEKQTRLF